MGGLEAGMAVAETPRSYRSSKTLRKTSRGCAPTILRPGVDACARVDAWPPVDKERWCSCDAHPPSIRLRRKQSVDVLIGEKRAAQVLGIEP